MLLPCCILISLGNSNPIPNVYINFYPNLFLYIFSCEMPSFRWPDVSHDIALAIEVISHRPQKPVDWDAIAGTLSSAFSTEEKPVELKGRGCRERMDLLLRKYKDEDAKALKR